jgi:hypothetical protein
MGEATKGAALDDLAATTLGFAALAACDFGAGSADHAKPDKVKATSVVIHVRIVISC